MVTQVIKRDGTKQKYNIYKIATAISLAFNASKTEIPEDLYDEIEDNIESKLNNLGTPEVDIEYIQDLVVNFLESNYPEVGKHYKKVRAQRERARNRKSKILRDVKEKLDAKNIENQNANVDEISFGGREGEATSVLLKDLALNEYMSDMAVQLHLNNIGYTHDLNSYASGKHNCLTDPIDDVLAKGFKTKQTDVRPANSIATAAQLVAVHFQVQSLQQFGGISASHIDWSLAPYVAKSFTKHLGDGLRYIEHNDEYNDIKFHEWVKTNPKYPDGVIHMNDEEFKNLHPEAWKYAMDMTERETYQAIEGMYHNLNTLQSRSGNQLPFTSINYGTCTSAEGRMVTKAILDISIKGLGKLHKTPIFPCGIFQYRKGVNDKPGTPNYDLKRLALKSTSQRLYPNYANVDWSGNAGQDNVKQIKNDYINSLTEEQYNILLTKLEANKELQNKLGLKIINE